MVVVDDHQLENFDSPTVLRKECETVSEQSNRIDEYTHTIPKTSNDKKEDLPSVIDFKLPKGWPTYTTIGDLRLKFPHYNIAPTFFDGKRYSVSNTCSLDSSLFLLYYIYKSKAEQFRRLFDQNVPVCEELRKTFDFVENQDWDIARLYWISTHSNHLDRNKLNQHHDLYATADTNVFQYVREIQKYTI